LERFGCKVGDLYFSFFFALSGFPLFSPVHSFDLSFRRVTRSPSSFFFEGSHFPSLVLLVLALAAGVPDVVIPFW